jgi:hypothetical protein
MFAAIVRSWNEMSIYRKIRRICMIGLAIFGLWALTPYLYNRQVNEEFPSAPVVQAPAAQAPAAAPTTMAAPAAMADSAALAPTAMAAPAAMADSAAAPVPVATAMPAGPVAVATGNLIAGSFPGDRAEGKATVYRLEDGRQFLRLEDFSSTNGPDLFVTFHTGANPEQDKGEYFQIAALKGNKGNQNYDLPADIDVGRYKSVVIWCRSFNIVFGYATLQQGA